MVRVATPRWMGRIQVVLNSAIPTAHTPIQPAHVHTGRNPTRSFSRSTAPAAAMMAIAAATNIGASRRGLRDTITNRMAAVTNSNAGTPGTRYFCQPQLARSRAHQLTNNATPIAAMMMSAPSGAAMAYSAENTIGRNGDNATRPTRARRRRRAVSAAVTWADISGSAGWRAAKQILASRMAIRRRSPAAIAPNPSRPTPYACRAFRVSSSDSVRTGCTEPLVCPSSTGGGSTGDRGDHVGSARL